jgi:exodeoxyribonuclease VII small subunit
MKKPTVRAEPEGAAPPFEEALERLEHIVEELEGGTLTLEESLARYEEGVRLSRRLTQKLDEAEKRIEKLMEDEAGGPPTTAELDLEEPDAAGGEGQLPF